MTEANDLEAFIQKQKEKIARERNQLINKSPPAAVNSNTGPRKKWDKEPPSELKVVRKPGTPEETGLPLPIDTYDEKRKKLNAARHQEYNELISQLPSGRYSHPRTPEHVGLPLGAYEEKRKILSLERHREYNEMLLKTHSRVASVRSPPSPKHVGLDVGSSEARRRQLAEERSREYNDMLIQNPKMRGNRMKENIPPKPDTPEVGLVGKMGTAEEKRRRLQEERKQEYNTMLAEQNMRRTGHARGQGEFSGTLPGLQDRLSAQERQRFSRNQEYNQFLKDRERELKYSPRWNVPQSSHHSKPRLREKQRNQEYNEFLRQKKGGKDRGRSQTQDDDPRDKAPRQEEEEAYGTLPIKEHPSAEVRKVQQRNQEYNEFLRQKRTQEDRSRSQMNQHGDSDDDDYKQYLQERPPRKGWSTPTYDEILDKKRQEEKKYRKQDDPEMYNGGYLRASRSDGQLNQMSEDERRFRNIDRQIDTMKTQFPSEIHETRRKLLLEDPNWLDIASPRNLRPYKDLELDDDLDMLARLHLRSHSDHGGDMAKHLKNKRPPPAPSRAVPRLDDQPSYRAPLSHPPPRPTVPPGRQGDFAGTLLIGSEARASADQRRKEAYRRDLEEQMSQLKVNKQREKESELRVNATGEVDVGRRPERQALPEERPKPTRNYTDTEFSPRNILFDDKRDGSRLPKNNGILENGFQGLYYPSLLSGKNPYSSPQDEAYYYYGMRNPLDPSMASVTAPTLPETRLPATHDYAEPPRVRFDDQAPVHVPSIGNRHVEEPRKAGQFPSDDDRNRSQVDSKKAYQEELKRQIEEQKFKKQKDKEEKERYDQKIEKEAVVFDPFGRGGGGAPMRTQEGDIIADLRSMHLDNEDAWKSPRKTPQPPPRLTTEDSPPYAPSTSHPPTGSNTDEAGHARGGHGIFGEPMTDAQKNARTKYQDELRLQIEEKRRIEQLEKDAQKAEEMRLMQKIEEDNRKMQAELDAEKQKERSKQEAAQKQQEELRRQQEERKKEEERKRREVDEDRQQDLRKLEDEKRRQRQQGISPQEAAAETRSSSPPIPTLHRDPVQPSSPPVPSHKQNPSPAVNSHHPTPTSLPSIKNPINAPPTRNSGREAHGPKPPSSPPIPTLQRPPSNLRNQRLPTEGHFQLQQNEQRSSSPPVPTLQKNQPPASPPVPAARTQSRQSTSNPRVNSADVLGQLARMRQQLQSERMRVESSLKREKNEPDIYDPRMAPKAALGPSTRNNIDIFEVAHNNKPVSVRRAPTEQSNPSHVNEFSRLKGKRGSESRSDFRKIFPNTPLTNDALETQQRALLLQQESDIDRLRGSPVSTDMPGMNPQDLGLLRREPSITSANMLDSDSAFIEVPEATDLPYNARQREPEDHLRNNSARNRRRQPPSPVGGMSMGSQVSLDPEKIDRKNEERLRKLKNITGDELSMGDPDDILDRFMAKQQHNRPPSGQTLQDDSWLRPGTRTDRG